MKTFSVRFFLRKAKSPDEQEMRIFARISINNKRTDFAINRSVRSNDWERKGSKPKPRTPALKELQKFMFTIEERLYAVERELFENGIPITGPNLVRRFNELVTGKKSDSKTVCMIFDLHNKQVAELHRKGQVVKPTVIRYNTTKNYVVEFMKETMNKEDLPLCELKYFFVLEFDHWVRTKKNCAHNTTLKYIKNLRKVIKMAVDYDWLDKDPFSSFKSKANVVNRDYLELDELRRIENLPSQIKRLEKVRNLFLFSCYTGLSYVDLIQLRPEEIILDNTGDKWIIKKRRKTNVVSRIPLLNKAEQIANFYISHPKSLRNGTVFPAITNQRLNGYLKEIADLTGIKKNLTFHIARHTFATTVTLANGVSLESVSAQLGHTNTKQTQHYAKMVNSRIKREMDVVKELFK